MQKQVRTADISVVVLRAMIILQYYTHIISDNDVTSPWRRRFTRSPDSDKRRREGKL